jgi:hypothetical protein
MQTNITNKCTINIPVDRVINDRRLSPRQPLMLTAWIWRAKAPAQPITIRLLDHSEHGVGFICPFPLDTGERFDLGLECEGQRRSGFQVTHCEFFSDDTFRIGATA